MKLRQAIRNTAKNVLKGGRNDGLLNGTVPYGFQHKNKDYELYATKEGSKVFIKLHNKTDNKTIILKEDSFLESAQTDFHHVVTKANTLAGAKKPATGQPRAKPSFIKDQSNVQQAFPADVFVLAGDVKQFKCVATDGGCFAAGTNEKSKATQVIKTFCLRILQGATQYFQKTAGRVTMG